MGRGMGRWMSFAATVTTVLGAAPEVHRDADRCGVPNGRVA